MTILTLFAAAVAVILLAGAYTMGKHEGQHQGREMARNMEFEKSFPRLAEYRRRNAE